MKIIQKPTQRSLHRIKEWERKYKQAIEKGDTCEAKRCIKGLLFYYTVVD